MSPDWHCFELQIFFFSIVRNCLTWHWTVFKRGSSYGQGDKMSQESSIYDFTVKDLHNNDYKLSKFDNNQVLLIINFATNDELGDRIFLELKDLKLKFCDGEMITRGLNFIIILQFSIFPQTFQSFFFLAISLAIQCRNVKAQRFIAGANLKALSLLKFSRW